MKVVLSNHYNPTSKRVLFFFTFFVFLYFIGSEQFVPGEPYALRVLANGL